MCAPFARIRAAVVGLAICYGVVFAQSGAAPKIWDDAALADWATPVAALNIRPAHYSAAEYYAAREDNYQTYPVYHPDSEPPGYWEDLKKRKPAQLVDASKMRTERDWIVAGERAFREMDEALARTSDPALMALARDPKSFEGVLKLNDGTALGPRWVVTPEGVQLGFPACGGCHFSLRPDRTVDYAGPGGPIPPGLAPVNPRGNGGAAATLRGIRTLFGNEPLATALWRQFTVPWAPDERVEKIRTMSQAEIVPLFGSRADGGTFPRIHGSPFFATKVPDLRLLRYYRYIDATGTHRLRGPEDVARYAALITGADPMDFGAHRILTDQQRRMRFRYADEVLYAIGVYLMALEPPRNPAPAPKDVLDRGEQIFRRERCVECHVPPAYTSAKLTLAHGWKPESAHPNFADVHLESVGTDPGLALKTRKGTGFYKIPSLRGVWYRPKLLHDASFASLEEMFDPARLRPDFRPKGWNPPGVTQRPVYGHQFGLKLNPAEKAVLLAFLRSL